MWVDWVRVVRVYVVCGGDECVSICMYMYMGVVWWLGVADFVVEVLGRTGDGRRLKSRDREDSPHPNI